MDNSLPARDMILKMLDDLKSGSVQRTEIASWAMAIIDDDSVRVADRAVMRAIKRLGAVDLPAPDRDYLYNEADFDEWKADLLDN